MESGQAGHINFCGGILHSPTLVRICPDCDACRCCCIGSLAEDEMTRHSSSPG
jgi:hypothetical protein